MKNLFSMGKRGELEEIKIGLANNQFRYLNDNPQYRGNKEVVLLCVKTYGPALEFASPDLKRDEEVCLEAIKQNGRALEFCSPDLKRRKDFVMRAVKLNGSALMYAAPSLQAEKDVVMEALKTAGYVLEFASPRLKADREIVLQAMKSDPRLLLELSPHFKNREFYLDLTVLNPYALNVIRMEQPNILDDMDFVLKALNRNGKVLLLLSSELKRDPLLLSYAKYSDQPLELTPEQDAIVIPFLQEKKNTFDSFKKTLVTSSNSQTNELSGLTRHGPYYKKFLENMYAMSGLSEEIVFILNKINPRGGSSKTKRKRKIKKKSYRV